MSPDISSEAGTLLTVSMPGAQTEALVCPQEPILLVAPATTPLTAFPCTIFGGAGDRKAFVEALSPGLQTQAKGAEVSTDHLKLFLSRRRWQVSVVVGLSDIVSLLDAPLPFSHPSVLGFCA